MTVTRGQHIDLPAEPDPEPIESEPAQHIAINVDQQENVRRQQQVARMHKVHRDRMREIGEIVR